jgi:voltage-gated potassium channel
MNTGAQRMSTEELIADQHKIQRQFRIAAAVSLFVLGGGAAFYHSVEHLNWLDSFYFCTITLTTIGYGDIVPKTNAGKLFTILYVLIGIGIIAFLVNILIKNAVLKRELRKLKKNSA